jgi:hypothetical protein
MKKEKSSRDAIGGQREILAAYKPSEGREKMASNVGEYQRPDDKDSTNC